MRSLVALLTALSVSIAAEPGERRFKLDISVSVDKMPTLTELVDFWIPIPHNDAYQSIAKLNIEAPYAYKIEKGQLGNQMLHFRVAKPLDTSFMLSIQCIVKRREHAAPNPGESNTEPDRLVPLDDKIRAVAQAAVRAANAQTDLEKARAIYNHIADTVKYDKTGSFIGYARALGIPARFSAGLSVPAERGEGKITGGRHGWAEFYIKGMGWIPVDASAAARDPSRRPYFFGALDENRVEFSRGRDVTLTPRQHAEPLTCFVYPYVEVDGKPYANVTWTYRYSDLNR